MTGPFCTLLQNPASRTAIPRESLRIREAKYNWHFYQQIAFSNAIYLRIYICFVWQLVDLQDRCRNTLID
jgi:hypothetical protein